MPQTDKQIDATKSVISLLCYNNNIFYPLQYSAGQGVMIQVNGTQGGESQFWPAPMPKQSSNNDSVNVVPRPSTITLHIGSPGVPTVTTYIEAAQGPPDPVHSEFSIKASAF